MSNKLWLYGVIAVVFMGIGAVVGILGWQAARAGSGEPSETISAPTLDINAEPTYSQTQAVEFATENAALEEAITALEATNEANVALAEDNAATADAALVMAQEQADMAATQAAVTEEPTALPPTETAMPSPEPTAIPPTEEPASAERILYRIVQEESEARFNIDETLRGADITVVGVTNEVAGDVIVNFGNPSASQVGTIRINVRTLTTDNDFRNRALRSDILESAQDEFEFSDFVPTSLDGLPDSAAVGDMVEFQITGDLDLHGVTRSLTFDATVTLVSEERIEGYASTTILYSDFNIVVPQPPPVSFIDDEVVMEIEFVALAVDE